MTTQPSDRWQWCCHLDDLVFDALSLTEATMRLAFELEEDEALACAIRATLDATKDKLKAATDMLADDPHQIGRAPS